MGLQLAIVVGLVLAVVLLVFLVVVTYNNIVALQRRCQRAWANIDVALKQRYDQLPNLVAAVRGGMAFEEQVLEAVTRARAAYAPDASIHDQAMHCERSGMIWLGLVLVSLLGFFILSRTRRHGRILWFLVILVLGPLGLLCWLITGRSRGSRHDLAPEQRRPHPPPPGRRGPRRRRPRHLQGQGDLRLRAGSRYFRSAFAQHCQERVPGIFARLSPSTAAAIGTSVDESRAKIPGTHYA